MSGHIFGFILSLILTLGECGKIPDLTGPFKEGNCEPLASIKSNSTKEEIDWAFSHTKDEHWMIPMADLFAAKLFAGNLMGRDTFSDAEFGAFLGECYFAMSKADVPGFPYYISFGLKAVEFRYMCSPGHSQGDFICICDRKYEFLPNQTHHGNCDHIKHHSVKFLKIDIENKYVLLTLCENKCRRYWTTLALTKGIQSMDACKEAKQIVKDTKVFKEEFMIGQC